MTDTNTRGIEYSIFSTMEKLIQKELGYSTMKTFGSGGGGCISNGQSYKTEQGKIFVKMNSKPKVCTLI